MLDAATEYMALCDASLENEETEMVELAYEQISALQNRILRLSKKMEELDHRLRNRLTQLSGQPGHPTKRQSAKGSGS
jgi:molecular chaperone GrpE (heat shock protein)